MSIIKEAINQRRYSQTMKYYSAKRNELLNEHVATSMHFKIIIVCETSQTASQKKKKKKEYIPHDSIYIE